MWTFGLRVHVFIYSFRLYVLQYIQALGSTVYTVRGYQTTQSIVLESSTYFRSRSACEVRSEECSRIFWLFSVLLYSLLICTYYLILLFFSISSLKSLSHCVLKYIVHRTIYAMIVLYTVLFMIQIYQSIYTAHVTRHIRYIRHTHTYIH